MNDEIETNFRDAAIRSRVYLDGAKGESCKLRFVDVCTGDRDTVVACHLHDGAFGMARKAHDFAVIDGCYACHMWLDHGWAGKITREVRLEHMLRGVLETMLNRLKRGIISIPLDVEKPRSERAAKPRKPKAQRVRIESAGFPKIQRQLKSKNTLRRREKQ